MPGGSLQCPQESPLRVLGGAYVVRVGVDFPRVIPACRAVVPDSDRTKRVIESSLRVRGGALVVVGIGP